VWEVNRLNTHLFNFEAEEQSHMGIDLNEESKPTHYERDLIKTEA